MKMPPKGNNHSQFHPPVSNDAPGAATWKRRARGVLLTLAYTLLTSVSLVFLHHVGSRIPTAVSLFYMALASSVIFNVVDYRNMAASHRSAARHWSSFATMSIAFVVNWLFSYYSVTHAPAEFFVGEFFLTLALCSCLREVKWSKAAVCLAAGLTVYFLSAAPLTVLATSAAAGVSMYVYYSSSLLFSRSAGLGPISVVAMRCYLLFGCAAGYLIGTRSLGSLAVSQEVAWQLAFLVLANMVIPSFLSQTCLHLVGVHSFTFMTSLIPVLTLGLQASLNNAWQPGVLMAALAATLALNYEGVTLALGRVGKTILLR